MQAQEDHRPEATAPMGSANGGNSNQRQNGKTYGQRHRD
jgi:hypothetical protein